jgi:DNA-binding NarL/FixJ family response regulator
MAESIRTVICDDNDLSLQGTRATFQADSRFVVVRTYRRLDHRLQGCSHVVDLLILDPFREGHLNVEPGLLPQLGIPILVYTEHFDVGHFLSFLKAGIAGYLVKSRTSSARLLRTAHSLTSDAVLVFDRSILQHLMTSSRIIAFVALPQQTKLTIRETEILELMCEGFTDQEIARMRCIAISTVETHVSNICRKLGASNRFDCAIKAVKSGVIDFRQHPGGADAGSRWDGDARTRRSLIA